jgi:outer membrane protein assembly factor BamD
MRKTFGCLLLLGCLLLTACKSEYEKIRTSGDAKLILAKAFEYYNKKQYLRSQGLFDLVLTTIKGDPKAEEAYFKYAYTYYHQEQFTLAAYYFKTFSNTYTNSLFREEAAFMSAYSNYLQSPSYRLEQSSTQTAIEEFQLFVNLFPDSRRVEESNQRIDELRRKLEEKAFAEGELYYHLRQYQSAVISFDNLLKDYPESPDAERVRYLIAKSDYLLSNNSIIERKEDRYNETIRRCEEFLEKYPAGKYVSEVKEIKKNAADKLREVRDLLKKHTPVLPAAAKT